MGKPVIAQTYPQPRSYSPGQQRDRPGMNQIRRDTCTPTFSRSGLQRKNASRGRPLGPPTRNNANAGPRRVSVETGFYPQNVHLEHSAPESQYAPVPSPSFRRQPQLPGVEMTQADSSSLPPHPRVPTPYPRHFDQEQPAPEPSASSRCQPQATQVEILQADYSSLSSPPRVLTPYPRHFDQEQSSPDPWQYPVNSGRSLRLDDGVSRQTTCASRTRAPARSVSPLSEAGDAEQRSTTVSPPSPILETQLPRSLDPRPYPQQCSGRADRAASGGDQTYVANNYPALQMSGPSGADMDVCI